MANIDDLFSAVQQAVQAINTLNQTLAAAFPQADAAVTHSATAGGDTLPANPSGFLTITLDGVAYKVPLYDA
jgi:hypothetical protein